MAIISMRDAAYAAKPLFAGDGSGFGQIHYEVRSIAVQTGGIQTRATGLPRYTFKLALPSQMNQERAGRWRALLMSLRGGVNHLEAYDPAHQFPTGSARNDSTTGAIAKGALSGQINGAGTLLAGDWVQIGSTLGASQIVMVTADATLPATVQFTPPAFFAFASGSRARFSRPCSFFKAVGRIPDFGGAAGTTNIYGVSVDFLEVFN
jgi:hypothetical protein